MKRATKTYKQAELNEFTPAAARKEYQRLRKIAGERIKRLERNELTGYIEEIPDLPQSRNLNNTELYKALKEVNRFIKNPWSLVNKIRAHENYMVKQLHESGYTFVNKGNIRDVLKALGALRKAAGDQNFDSDEALEYIEEVERLNISWDDFFKNLQKYIEYDPEELAKLEPIKTGREMKIGDVKRKIRTYERKSARS